MSVHWIIRYLLELALDGFFYRMLAIFNLFSYITSIVQGSESPISQVPSQQSVRSQKSFLFADWKLILEGIVHGTNDN